jgi:hypothetical protein
LEVLERDLGVSVEFVEGAGFPEEVDGAGFVLVDEAFDAGLFAVFGVAGVGELVGVAVAVVEAAVCVFGAVGDAGLGFA